MEFFTQLTTQIVTFFMVLALAAIAAMWSERVGIVNIGINGNVLMGGIFYALVANWINQSNPWFQIPVFIITGILTATFSSLHGFATIKLKGNQVISGIAIGSLAVGLAFLCLNVFGTAQKISYKLERLALSPHSQDIENIVSFSTFSFIFIAIFSLVVLNKTRWGLRMKAIGENPQAVDVAGVNVSRIKWQGFLISGFICGIAGAIFSQNLGSENMTANVGGVGFLALAVMIVGRWNTSLIILAAFLFATLRSTATTLSFTNIDSLKSLKESVGIYLGIVPYVITLIFLGIFSSKIQGPKAAGVPYEKSKR